MKILLLLGLLLINIPAQSQTINKVVSEVGDVSDLVGIRIPSNQTKYTCSKGYVCRLNKSTNYSCCEGNGKIIGSAYKKNTTDASVVLYESSESANCTMHLKSPKIAEFSKVFNFSQNENFLQPLTPINYKSPHLITASLKNDTEVFTGYDIQFSPHTVVPKAIYKAYVEIDKKSGQVYGYEIKDAEGTSIEICRQSKAMAPSSVSIDNPYSLGQPSKTSIVPVAK
jgi:hypothetical protein